MKVRLNTQELTSKLLLHGENPKKEGLLETPKRVKKIYDEFSSGYSKNTKDFMLQKTIKVLSKSEQ